MLRKKFPFDSGVLYANNIRGDPGKLIQTYLSGISDQELRRLAEQVKQFLFKGDDNELILKAPQYAHNCVAAYNELT